MKSMVILIVVLTGLKGFAGPRIVGNGGIGVKDSRGLYMLDLYERGIHTDAYYAPDTEAVPWIKEELAQAFDRTNIASVPMDRLAYKVAEVFNKSFIVGLTLHKSLLKIDWRLLDVNLVPTEDTKTPLDGLELKQIAVRQGNVVFISSNAWNQLDDDNKVALLIHEAFYYSAPVEMIQISGLECGEQSAVKTRSMTGLVFTKRFATEGFTDSNNLLGTFEDPRKEYMKIGRVGFLEEVFISSDFSSGGHAGMIKKFATNDEIEKSLGRLATEVCGRNF